jgi:Protein of unknown function (DUF3572)
MKARSQDVRQVAETVAIQALSFLAAEPTRLGRFLAETGLGPETLRGAANSPEFLVSVLDFVLSDEDLVKDFAAANELKPSTVSAAREALGGPSWERDAP